MRHGGDARVIDAEEAEVEEAIEAKPVLELRDARGELVAGEVCVVRRGRFELRFAVRDKALARGHGGIAEYGGVKLRVRTFDRNNILVADRRLTATRGVGAARSREVLHLASGGALRSRRKFKEEAPVLIAFPGRVELIYERFGKAFKRSVPVKLR